MSYGIQQYRQVDIRSKIENANPHQIICYLFDGALQQITVAKFSIEQKKINQKSTAINKALDIVRGLRVCLDMKKGGDIASELDRLYEFIEGHLLQANIKNDTQKLDECKKLIEQVKSGWEQISQEHIDKFMVEQG